MPPFDTALTTASAPAATLPTDGGSVTSAPVARVAAVTAWPRCLSSAAIRVPIMPVAPKTTMFIWVAPVSVDMVCFLVWLVGFGNESGGCAGGDRLVVLSSPSSDRRGGDDREQHEAGGAEERGVEPERERLIERVAGGGEVVG